MKRLQSNEIQLIGSWTYQGDRVTGDDVCERIEWLTSHVLEQVAVSREYGAWETLFRDPQDGRFWERTYPQSEMQGGGPPILSNLSEEKAGDKYGLAEIR